jgi:spore cortex formation protein SpoVR/YcgB (stage V sporulation)
MTDRGGKLLFEGAEWNFNTIADIHDACAVIAKEELGLNTYKNRIEVITSEQMLDAYASTGMPLFYKHWSFGKQFVRNESLYRKGWQGLAYEIVINSNPCVVYIMEENTATMQALVLAHAAFGHNHFFKNNYAFKQWTDADGILDYLAFAKRYVAECEERYGFYEVERVLDAAHALQGQGIDRYPGKRSFDLGSEQKRERERREYAEKFFNDLWRTVPEGKKKARANDTQKRRALLGLPEENLLYFLEKTAPRLKPWQRELIRIVRLISQYFYPQRQTKMMNEGCATYVHYHIMRRLHETGQINDGSYLEFLHSHTSVVMQPDYDDPRHRGMNPYALGFAMMQDIERICVSPTDEDRQWFPDLAGRGDPYNALKDVWANYRDESCIAQFLSPNLIRSLGLFLVVDSDSEDMLSVDAIHNERGYLQVRRRLARLYDVARFDPDIQVVDVDLDGDRRLEVRHQVVDGVTLEDEDAERVLQHLANLWGYPVHMIEVDEHDSVCAEHIAEPLYPFT